MLARIFVILIPSFSPNDQFNKQKKLSENTFRTASKNVMSF